MTSFYGDNFSADGRLFHNEGKTRIMSALRKGGDLLNLAGLIVKDEWLKDDGEGNPPNTQFLIDMQQAFLTENRKTLNTLSKPLQTAIEQGSKWLIVLYRQDHMYFERIGAIITFILTMYPVYENDLPGLLFALKGWYFKNENREDRVLYFQEIFSFVDEKYATEMWFREFVSWAFRYIYQHRAEFNWQVSLEAQPGISVYDPQIWCGGERGRGKEWFIVNGGKG